MEGKINLSNNNLVFSSSDSDILLYHTESLEWMKEISQLYPDGIFDMIFADPPYFLSNGGITCHSGKMVSVDKGSWDKSMGVEKNHEFNLRWLGLCQKLLKKDGTIWVSGTHHVIYSVGFAMQQLGFKILNDIIWIKPSPPPNLSCRYFTHSTEIILWAAKSKESKHTYNYELMKEINNGKQMKNVWHIAPPSSDEKIFGKHPTQKPVALLERIILASTHENNLVFDPFAGSATTAIACIKHNRKFVGCELEKDFVEISIKRINHALQMKSQKIL